MTTIEMRNGHIAESFTSDTQLKVPDLTFALDAGQAISKVDVDGSCVVTDVGKDDIALGFAKSLAWIASKCYGQNPLLIDNTHGLPSRRDAEKIVGKIEEFGQNTDSDRLLIINSLNSLTGEDFDNQTSSQALIGSSILRTLKTNPNSRILAVSTRRDQREADESVDLIPSNPVNDLISNFAIKHTFGGLIDRNTANLILSDREYSSEDAAAIIDEHVNLLDMLAYRNLPNTDISHRVIQDKTPDEVMAAA